MPLHGFVGGRLLGARCPPEGPGGQRRLDKGQSRISKISTTGDARGLDGAIGLR